MGQQTFSVSILLRQEQNGVWAAQCLEWDIAAQGKTISEAKHAIEKAFVGQMVVDITNGMAPLATVPSAPEAYWKEFEHGELLAAKKSFFIPGDLTYRAKIEEIRIAA